VRSEEVFCAEVPRCGGAESRFAPDAERGE